MPMLRSHAQHLAVVLFHVYLLQPRLSFFDQPRKSWNVILNDRIEDGLHLSSRTLMTGASRGYAFVEYETEKEMLRAYEPQTQHLRSENQNLKENMERLRNEIAEIRHVVLLC
ncbi:hypothetical protein Bca101_039254 [Brassica carinata]